MLKSLELHSVGPIQDLSAGFGERLNVLTGDNGLGKSFLLDVAFWALTGAWPGGRVALPEPGGKKDKPTITYQITGKNGSAGRKTARFDFRTQSWARPPGRLIMPGLVVYAAVDDTFGVWDPARNYGRDTPPEQTEFPSAYHFTRETLANGSRDNGRVLCDGLVRDWVSWYDQQASRRTTSPFPLLERVIGLLSHPEEQMTAGQPRRLYLDDTREFPTITMPYGNVPFPQLSAGVRRIVSLAYLLVWAWHEHTRAAKLRKEKATTQLVLLVDEIEAHLHPKWQRVILPALLKVAEGLQARIAVQVIVATHSPLVLASLEPLFDERKDHFFWCDLDKTRVHFRQTPWQKHGDVVGWLTSEIFGLKQARSQEAERAIAAAHAYLRGDQAALPPGLRSREQIDQALRDTLPTLDPFWPRWMVNTDQ
jgi:hypothetical protein